MAPLSIRYRVDLSRPQDHRIRVTMEVSGAVEPVTLRMPSWIPGSYLLRDYARYVTELTASCDGRPVAVEKLDDASWRVDGSGGQLRVSFAVFAFDLSVRGAYLDDCRGFFNGTCLFPWVVGQEQTPVELTIVRPEAPCSLEWRVATAMTAEDVDERGFGLYRADNYDELIDHPVEIADFDQVDFTVCGVRHRIAVSGRHSGDLDRLAADLTQLCEAQIKFFGEPAPVTEYLFLGLATSDGYGGLEHRSSCSLIFARDDLPQPGESGVPPRYRQLLGLFSHEYFHTWHVKRSKPAVFLPYQLDRRSHTELLWIFEGFTTYYQDLLIRRAGLLSEEGYLERLGQTLTRVYRVPGRLEQSAAESSFDAWDKLYKPTVDSINSTVSYYSKGALAALALDLTIRRESNGRFSLDDVVVALWDRFGKEGVGLPENGFEPLLREVTGLDLTAFLRDAVHGRDDLPLEEYLEYFGVVFALRPSLGPKDRGGVAGDVKNTPAVSLGCTLTSTANGVVVQQVLKAGAAESAGVAPGDELIAVDGFRLRSADVGPLLKGFDVGDEIELTVSRGNTLLTRTALLAAPALDTCYLTLMEDASREQLDRRRRWLGE